MLDLDFLSGIPNTEPMGPLLSHGCVRLRNDKLLLLFGRVPAYCLVRLDEAACPYWASLHIH